MTSLLIVTIIFGSFLAFAALVCGTILAVVKTRRAGLSKEPGQSQTDEAAIIQELYHGLTRMEERIEALETILMEGQEKDRGKQ